MRAAYVRLLANNGTVLQFNGGAGGVISIIPCYGAMRRKLIGALPV